MPELRIYGLSPDQLEHVIAHHAMTHPGCAFEGSKPPNTVGRWSRGGWHDLVCWRTWIANPEADCSCPEPVAR